MRNEYRSGKHHCYRSHASTSTLSFERHHHQRLINSHSISVHLLLLQSGASVFRQRRLHLNIRPSHNRTRQYDTQRTSRQRFCRGRLQERIQTVCFWRNFRQQHMCDAAAELRERVQAPIKSL